MLTADATPVDDSTVLPLATPAIVLTKRELQVLTLMADGLSNKQIADRLDVSEHTAKFHVNAVITKVGGINRTYAVAYALRSGMIS